MWKLAHLPPCESWRLNSSCQACQRASHYPRWVCLSQIIRSWQHLWLTKVIFHQIFFPATLFCSRMSPCIQYYSPLDCAFSDDLVLDELKDFGGLWNYFVWISMMSWTWSVLSWKRKTMEAKFTHSSWFITADNCGPVTDKMFISFTPHTHYKVTLPSFSYPHWKKVTTCSLH